MLETFLPVYILNPNSIILVTLDGYVSLRVIIALCTIVIIIIFTYMFVIKCQIYLSSV